jgi:hypothetical protein
VSCSANVYYFAQSTGNPSSSYPSDSWTGAITVTNGQGGTATATSSIINVNVLTAINITTSSISYGTVKAGGTTGSTNQTTTVQNAGNSSTTLELSGTALLNAISLSAPADTSSTINTSTNASSTAFGGNQRKIFWDSVDNLFWAFYYNGSAIQYSNSSNTSAWSTIGTTGSSTSDFSVWNLAGSTTVYLAYAGNGANVQQGTLASSSITWGATTLADASTSDAEMSITQSGTGNLWITYECGVTINICAQESTNADSTAAWGPEQLIIAHISNDGFYNPVVVPMTTTGNALFTYTTYNSISQKDSPTSRLWVNASSSFGTAITIDSSTDNGTSQAGDRYSVVAGPGDTAHILYIGGCTNAGCTQGPIKYAEFSSGAWSTPITLSASTTDSYPSLSIDTANNSNLYAFIISTGTIYEMKGSSPYSSSSWSSPSPIVTSGTSSWVSGAFQAENMSGMSYVPFIWTQGTASPYNVNFYGKGVNGQNLIAIATSSQNYATSSFTVGSGGQQLSGSPTAVSGFTLSGPTSTISVQNTIYWGAQVSSGSPTGTYVGSTTFTSIFSQ